MIRKNHYPYIPVIGYIKQRISKKSHSLFLTLATEANGHISNEKSIVKPKQFSCFRLQRLFLDILVDNSTRPCNFIFECRQVDSQRNGVGRQRHILV